jgi:hypothetical protein
MKSAAAAAAKFEQQQPAAANRCTTLSNLLHQHPIRFKWPLLLHPSL